MTLAEFKDYKGFTYIELAEFLGFSENMAYRMCKGIGCMTLKNAYQIMQKTKGTITYADLLVEMSGDC